MKTINQSFQKHVNEKDNDPANPKRQDQEPGTFAPTQGMGPFVNTGESFSNVFETASEFGNNSKKRNTCNHIKLTSKMKLHSLFF